MVGQTIISSFDTDTWIEFDFPSLPEGYYAINVNVNDLGDADHVWAAKVSLSVTSFTRTSGSRGGSILTIIGTGFN